MTDESTRHADRSNMLPAEVLAAVIGRNLGQLPQRIVGHETLPPRIVWEAVLPSGLSVFAKGEYEAGDGGSVVLEAWAIEQARQAGVSAPEVLALDVSASVFPGPVLILAAMPGAPLPPVWRTPANGEAVISPEATLHAWNEAGRQLRLLHGVRVSGNGPLDDAVYLRGGGVRGRLSSWRTFALDPALSALAAMEAAGVLRGREAGAVRGWLTPAEFPDRPDYSALLHGDVGAKHVWVDPQTGRFSGFIDFGDRMAGSPVWDLANAALWEDDNRVGALVDGYGGDVAQQLRVFTVAQALPLAHRRITRGMPTADVTAWLAGRIDAAIQN